MKHTRIYLLLASVVGLAGIAFLAFSFQKLFFWYIDDAGISFAFARNLLDGKLVAQLGAEPVEGYSNPLWVFLQTIAMALTTVKAVIITKYMAVFFYALIYLRIVFSFWGKYRLLFLANVVFFFLSTQPAITIWAFSGLENSLYLWAGVELLINLARALSVPRLRVALWMGVAASVLALTRPEGIMYAPLCAIILFIVKGNRGLKCGFVSLALPVITFAGYFVFRMYYFHDVFPNTYYAKGLPLSTMILDIITFQSPIVVSLFALMRSFFSTQYYLLIFAGILVCIRQTVRNGQSKLLFPIIFLCVWTAIVFLLLPADWMSELRFATLTFCPFYLLVVYSVWRGSGKRRIPILFVLMAVSAWGAIQRINNFTMYPQISIDEVRYRNDYFVRWGNQLKLTKPSILIVDIGGILMENQLQVVDLGMLCDKKIARCLGEANRPENVPYSEFYDYVFSIVKPIFISTRSYHAWRAQLDGDSRFRRDYVPIHEYIDFDVLQKRGQFVWAGDYVRKEVVHDAMVLSNMCNEAMVIHYPFDNPELKNIMSSK